MGEISPRILMYLQACTEYQNTFYIISYLRHTKTLGEWQDNINMILILYNKYYSQ